MARLENEAVIFGGSFNPVHIGHLIIASILVNDYKISKLIIIPCAAQPLKKNAPLDGKHRLKMLNMSAGKIKNVFIDPYEIKKGGVSYTIDTVKYYKKKYKNVSLAVGEDSLYDIHKWEGSAELVSLLKKIYVYKRPGSLKTKRKTTVLQKKAVFIKGPLMGVSSTSIRNRVKKNLPVKFLTTREVENFIQKNGFYK